jgi:hypothetical protein
LPTIHELAKFAETMAFLGSKSRRGRSIIKLSLRVPVWPCANLQLMFSESRNSDACLTNEL